MKTSLYWIHGSWKGRLAIAPRPRGGDWLEDEIREWRQAGLDMVISLLTPDEATDLDLGKEEAWARANDLKFCSFPIEDRRVPASRSATVKLVRDLEKTLTDGKNIVVHCRQGIGRSALLAACLLIASGEEPETAFRRIGEARGCAVPETNEQRDWVTSLAADLVPLRNRP